MGMTRSLERVEYTTLMDVLVEKMLLVVNSFEYVIGKHRENTLEIV